MPALAHVGGVPVEELIPAAAGVGTALLLARTWMAVRLRRRRVARASGAGPRSVGLRERNVSDVG